jgi:hypothetical protein
MIMTRIDPAKLEAFAILRREGFSKEEICAALKISPATYYRRMEETDRFEKKATNALNSDD